MIEEDEERYRIRRGSEHVRIKGTTEELGEIVPGPVMAEDERRGERSEGEAEREDERR